jgi:peptide/nickel transport system permease protein
MAVDAYIPQPDVARKERSRTTLSPWVGFLLRRVLSLAIILVGLVIATFLIVRLVPGDPAASVAGISADQAGIDRIREQLGLDLPLSQQFWDYISGLFRGDLGASFYTQQPVTQVLGQSAGPSIELAVGSLLVVFLISVPLGLVSAALAKGGRNKRGEVVFTAVTSIFGALPEFLMATFLSLIFAVWLRLLPAAGTGSITTLILPVAAVSIRPIAILARMVRVETLGALSTDYARTARGKRLPTRLMYMRHVLPNVLSSALTMGGLLFPGLVGAAVVVENVFARAGLGTQLVTAVVRHDYPVIQGCILVLGIVVVGVNTIVDLAIALIDPRALTGTV